MAETLRPDPLTPEHRLLMPPHPGEVYQSSALCSCGDWQFDADSFSDLTNEYRLVLTEHTAHARAALRAVTPDPAEPGRVLLLDECHCAGACLCPDCQRDCPRPDRPAEPGLPWLRARVRDVVHRQYDANDIDRWAILKAIDAALSDTARTEGLDVERLRVATWRLSNAADALGRYARRADDPGHRSWFPSAIADVEREVALARDAAGPAPTTAEYARLAHPEDPA